ncbi:MAG TPA: energy-coupling factor transporter transmembrane protein EcfT, partial [Candidatus Korarchaeota archaeon]|nr:energy-coupling factor transporter transmembrane protein EcfT [Candidatus Korarchaeota archaeon]
MPTKMRRSLLGYLPVDSPIFRLHPMTRLLFLLVVSAYPMLVRMPELNVAGSVFMLALFKISK